MNSNVDTDTARTGSDPIGIVGGTGPAGSSFALRLAASGHDVILGSRDETKSAAVVDRLTDRLPHHRSPHLRAGTNDEAAGCDLVLLAIDAAHIVAAALDLEPTLRAKTVVSMAAQVQPDDRGMRPTLPPRGSIAAELAHALPSSRVVVAFQHAPAKAVAAFDEPFPGDVLVCGDDTVAVEEVVDRLGKAVGATCHDAGGLHNAVAIEAMTAVILSLNIHQKSRHSLEIVET